MIISDIPDELKEKFRSPTDENTLWTYWYWLRDDISKEGITKDLQAMKKVGIGTAFIGNINPEEIDGKIPMLSDQWWDHMVHAVEEGKRLGVDIGVFNCPGWSQSGGPWVTYDKAMRHLVYSEIKVEGGRKLDLKLEKPAVGGLQASRVLHLADLIEKAVSMPSEDILLGKGI